MSLDAVNWTKLRHAHGSAENVPGWLQELRVPDPECRRAALRSLRSSICHQGSRYTASAAAVPFLLELLEEPEQPGRDEVLAFLAELAVGSPYAAHPAPFQTTELRSSHERRAYRAGSRGVR